jgi:hypothetical protein
VGYSRKNVKLTAGPRAAAAAAILRVANERAAIAPVIAELRENGVTSLEDIARGLNQRGVTTARGGTRSARQVARVLARRSVAK